MSENRVVEALRAIKETRVELQAAERESKEALLRATQANNKIINMLRQVEWGVSTNKPERVIQVDGSIFVIRYVRDQSPTVEHLVVEQA